MAINRNAAIERKFLSLAAKEKVEKAKQKTLGDVNNPNASYMSQLVQEESLINAQRGLYLNAYDVSIGDLRQQVINAQRASLEQQAITGLYDTAAQMRDQTILNSDIDYQLGNVLNSSIGNAVNFASQQEANKQAQVQASYQALIENEADEMIEDGRAQVDHMAQAGKFFSGALAGAMYGFGATYLARGITGGIRGLTGMVYGAMASKAFNTAIGGMSGVFGDYTAAATNFNKSNDDLLSIGKDLQKKINISGNKKTITNMELLGDYKKAFNTAYTNTQTFKNSLSAYNKQYDVIGYQNLMNKGNQYLNNVAALSENRYGSLYKKYSVIPETALQKANYNFAATEAGGALTKSSTIWNTQINNKYLDNETIPNKQGSIGWVKKDAATSSTKFTPEQADTRLYSNNINQITKNETTKLLNAAPTARLGRFASGLNKLNAFFANPITKTAAVILGAAIGGGVNVARTTNYYLPKSTLLAIRNGSIWKEIANAGGWTTDNMADSFEEYFKTYQKQNF